jgi:hypothetical protein
MRASDGALTPIPRVVEYRRVSPYGSLALIEMVGGTRIWRHRNECGTHDFPGDWFGSLVAFAAFRGIELKPCEHPNIVRDKNTDWRRFCDDCLQHFKTEEATAPVVLGDGRGFSLCGWSLRRRRRDE